MAESLIYYTRIILPLVLVQRPPLPPPIVLPAAFTAASEKQRLNWLGGQVWHSTIELIGGTANSAINRGTSSTATIARHS